MSWGRHFYTAAETGSLGSPGFQTVAHSASLRGALPALERLAAGFQSPSEPAGKTPRPVHRVGPVADLPGRCCITRFTPLGACPDGRRGNYLAQTAVVPLSWIERLEWDPGAALESIAFCDPARAPGPGENGPSVLDDRPLPEVGPRPLARLDALVDRLPLERIAELALALARQVSIRGPVVVRGRPGAGPGEVDLVVGLAPLTLPPPCRLRGSNPRQPLSLWSPLVDPPPEDLLDVDLAGVVPCEDGDPDDDDPRWTVIDLARPPHAPRFLEGAAYVAWLRQVLRAREWDRLGECYRAAGRAAGASFLERFSEPGRRRDAPRVP